MARLTAAPELSDPTWGLLPSSIHLRAPWLYVVLAPLFSLWDGISMLSQSRLEWFLIGLPILYLLHRAVVAIATRRWSWGQEARLFGMSLPGLVVFLCAGLLWHRPMMALAGVPPDLIVADLHGHTGVSHDVRNTLMRGYDAAANLRWHRRAGFDAVFITDHNTVEGLGPSTVNPVRCPGIEVSAWKAHVVLLGDSLPIDRSRYNGSLGELEALLQSSHSTYGALSLLSLPEFDRNHWQRLDTLVAAGADGFEIVNASPKAAEFSLQHRNAVIALAQRSNRFVAGVNDSHGWGATSLAWNLGLDRRARLAKRERSVHPHSGSIAYRVLLEPDRRATPPATGERVAPLVDSDRRRMGDMAKHGNAAAPELAGMGLGALGDQEYTPVTILYQERA